MCFHGRRVRNFGFQNECLLRNGESPRELGLPVVNDVLSILFVLSFGRHFQKPGFNYTLADVSNWAKRPLPGLDIFFIGDAYNRLRGWTEGAILSANNALLEGWKIREEEL